MVSAWENDFIIIFILRLSGGGWFFGLELRSRLVLGRRLLLHRLQRSLAPRVGVLSLHF
ncbi:hypothetical protein MFRU_056g00020 [Monilinia fructicola]|nr:hypothetical protein MFRU_056g00020 [Monilinia fructicola]